MSTYLLTVSIGIGLTANLLLSEIFGLAAGGVVVPGYLALYLDRPAALAVTLVVALLTFGFIRGLGSYVVLFGRRRISVAILVGYLLSVAFAEFVEPTVWQALFRTEWLARVSSGGDGFAVIGFVIPGLIAMWFDRQGVVQTLLSMSVGAILVRLTLVVILGPEAGL